MTRFDVALWRVWPSLWPEWIGSVEADNAYSAIVQMMQVYGRSQVARAAAISRDKRIRYSCIGVCGVDRGLVWFKGSGSRS